MDHARYKEIVEFLRATGEVIEGTPSHSALNPRIGEHGQVDEAFRYLAEIEQQLDEAAARHAIERADAEWWVYPEALRRAYAWVERER